MKKRTSEKKCAVSRRDFIKASAAVSLAALTSGTKYVFAAGSDKLRVGVIGCGRRGTDAVKNCVAAAAGVEIVAMGDVLKDRLDSSLSEIKKDAGDKIKVTEDTCFLGFDAYEKVIASDVDMVILTTPPHFRPAHFKAAVEAGKHVFMEKPLGVDPVGVRSVFASAELAEKKGLAVVVGAQRRHQPHYLEIMKRIHDGAIGQIVAAQCYWNWDQSKWHFHDRRPEWSDMEWQIRCWPYFTWLSGDHIVEQHLHNIDVINWALQAHPVRAMGMGGREVRTGPEYGNIYDHFAVDFGYPNGVRVMSMCRQMERCTSQVSERVVGTNGSAYTDGVNGFIEGPNAYKYEGPDLDPYVAEHADLITGIREGKPLNDARQVAESTLTAIMGRMSAYTGRALKWDWVMKASKLDLTPSTYELGDLPVRPVAIPGKTRLI